MTKIKMGDKSVSAGSTRACSRSLAVKRWIMMAGFSVALTSSHGVLAEEVANFARLALSCVHKEYPNHISHTLQDDADVAPPRELTPAFYGCLDWHSSVHGHWLLARLARLYPESTFVEPARAALAQSLTEANLLAETEYVSAKGRRSFERPYGIAWLLQLAAELEEWDDPQARVWREAIRSLEVALVERLTAWLPNLTYPVRSGTHSQTAFALGLALDWARVTGAQAQRGSSLTC